MITRRILAVFALTLMIAACKSNPSTTESSTTDGMTTDRGPLARNDVTFDNGAGTSGAPGSQEDLNAQAGDRVFFGYDSSELTGEGRAVLEKQAAWLNQYANVAVTIEGHADERGTREYNLALGERRAQAVKNYLVSLGVPAGRLNTISYGKERPAVMGSDEESYAKNRRGVTTVQ
ncbi:MAG: omp16 [Alphaproteobacteria bacterium]|nr:omp16 [Alphaproteobacteria bacterium]